MWELFAIDVCNIPEPERYGALLSQDEQNRLARYTHPSKANQYLISHVMLRCLLAERLDRSVASLNFIYGNRDKPLLVDAAIHFNLSHGEGISIIGISDQQIGVDVEPIDRKADHEALTERFFSDAEKSWIEAQQHKERAFFEIWTRKEAVLKASGLGISTNLSALNTTHQPIELKGGWFWKTIPYRNYIISLAGTSKLPNISPIAIGEEILTRHV